MPVPKAYMKLSLPVLASCVLTLVYNMVDMIIVGQKLGKVGLSAVSVGGDVTGFLTFIAMGFSSAGQVIISQYLGSGQKEKISRFIGTMFNFLMGIAVCVSIIYMLLTRLIPGRRRFWATWRAAGNTWPR